MQGGTVRGRGVLAAIGVAAAVVGGCAALLGDDPPFTQAEGGAGDAATDAGGACALFLARTSVDLGEQAVGTRSAPAFLAVTNDGGTPVRLDVRSESGGVFTVTLPQGDLAAGATANIVVTMNVPSVPDGGERVYDAGALLSAPGCSFDVTLVGTASHHKLLLDAPAVDLGEVRCVNATTPSSVVGFRAAPDAGGTWTATLTNPQAAFTLMGTSGVVEGGAAVTDVRVSPKAANVDPGPRNDTLQLVLTVADGGGVERRDVTLRETAFGPVLEFATPATVDAGATFTVDIRNRGDRRFEGQVSAVGVSGQTFKAVQLDPGAQTSTTFVAAADGGFIRATASATATPLCLTRGGTFTVQ
jgi:hypothetical protein